MKVSAVSAQWGFFLAVTLISAGMGFYIGRRLIVPLDWSRGAKTAAWAGLIAVMLLMMAGPMSYRLARYDAPPPWLDFLSNVSYTIMGFLSLVMFALVFADVARVAAKFYGIIAQQAGGPDAAIDISRREFLGNGFSAGVLGLTGGLSGYGYFEAQRRAQLEAITVPIARLPRDLQGFRIVQITDLHVGPTIKRRFVEDVVADTLALKPDLITVTGDLADGFPEQLKYDLDPLGELKAPHGVYYVTGNHEYYWSVFEWLDYVKTLGWKALNNGHDLVTRGDGRLLLAGVTDYSAGRFFDRQRSDPRASVQDAPAADAKILLAHQPRSCFAARDAGFDLQLSGHTHGGQFYPWALFVGLQQPFVRGMHPWGAGHVYVSRGTGYWGPPLRLGVPSEVTLITLAAV